MRAGPKILEQPLTGSKILLCGHGLIYFSFQRGFNSKTKHHLLSNIFWLNALKSTAKSPLWIFLKLNTLREIKITVLTRKKFDELLGVSFPGGEPEPSTVHNLSNYAQEKKKAIEAKAGLRGGVCERSDKQIGLALRGRPN